MISKLAPTHAFFPKLSVGSTSNSDVAVRIAIPGLVGKVISKRSEPRVNAGGREIAPHRSQQQTGRDFRRALSDVTTFHTDPENQFQAVQTVRSEIFPEAPFPNWTAVGVNWLAGFDFEVKVIARIPQPA